MIAVYADLCSNHKGRQDLYEQLVADIEDAGALPKIQLFSNDTFNRSWDPPEQFVASVFRPSDLDYIVPFAPLALKIASVESTYYELIKQAMETQLPLIVSTGGLDREELFTLINLLGDYQPGVCLMHCVSMYPTPPELVNLSRLQTIAEEIDAYGLDWDLGWSAHVDPRPMFNDLMSMMTMAYTFGATAFEVHVRPAKGSVRTADELVSLTPAMLKMMVGHLEQLDTWAGCDEITGPDREAVIKWRARWQEKEKA